mmetsp:Transcript_10952/g.19528  ORF Transcript_10952/g.19528 Transcript_10952/m.19528 type:complete len:244 (-) Transcript_10952:573-1304(-)
MSPASAFPPFPAPRCTSWRKQSAPPSWHQAQAGRDQQQLLAAVRHLPDEPAAEPAGPAADAGTKPSGVHTSDPTALAEASRLPQLPELVASQPDRPPAAVELLLRLLVPGTCQPMDRWQLSLGQRLLGLQPSASKARQQATPKQFRPCAGCNNKLDLRPSGLPPKTCQSACPVIQLPRLPAVPTATYLSEQFFHPEATPRQCLLSLHCGSRSLRQAFGQPSSMMLEPLLQFAAQGLAAYLLPF